MSSNLITKETLASALRELLKTQPLSKTSVKDITDYCDMSRNSFYYHFKDKYELISWIFYNDMLKNANAFDDPSQLTQSFVNVCQWIYSNRQFYQACFQYVGQNSLFEYLFEFYYELWKVNIDMMYSDHGIKLSEEELSLMAKLKSHAMVGLLTAWVNDGIKSNYMTYFEQLHDLLEPNSYSLISNQHLLNKCTSGNDSSAYRKKDKKIC